MKLETLKDDEHIYSGWARSRLMNAKQFMSAKRWQEFTGISAKSLFSQIPFNAQSMDIVFRYKDRNSVITDKELFLGHTTASTWLLTAESFEHLLNARIKRINLIESRSFGGHRGWRFCKECAAEELEKFGFSYWHVSHHLFGAVCCPKHGSILFKHKDLHRYDYSLPHQWIGEAEAMDLKHEWQQDWQPFIYQLSVALKSEPELPNQLRKEVYELFLIDRELTHNADKARFDGLFAEMHQDLGEYFLKEMFWRYARQHKYALIVLWVAVTDYSEMSGTKSPIYWLATIFWLRHKLPSLKGVINYDWNLNIH